LGAAALAATARSQIDYPPLLIAEQFPLTYFENPAEARNLKVQLLPSSDPAALRAKKVGVILTVPPNFMARLAANERPVLQLEYREKDDASRLAAKRLLPVLSHWKLYLRAVRLVRRGLPSDFDEPFDVVDKARVKPSDELAAEGMLDLLVRIFPFLLVMWSLAGALYPAVDVCAGEKERGTMETLLISPASRPEIVWGKFLTIWVFSAATALLNLASMGLTAGHFSGDPLVHPAGAAAVRIFQRALPGRRRLCAQLQGGPVLFDAALSDHHAAHLSHARSRRGAESVLQPGPGHGRRPVDATAHDRIA
jgi:sodium transport system permease protein